MWVRLSSFPEAPGSSTTIEWLDRLESSPLWDPIYLICKTASQWIFFLSLPFLFLSFSFLSFWGGFPSSPVLFYYYLWSSIGRALFTRCHIALTSQRILLSNQLHHKSRYGRTLDAVWDALSIPSEDIGGALLNGESWIGLEIRQCRRERLIKARLGLFMSGITKPTLSRIKPPRQQTACVIPCQRRS